MTNDTFSHAIRMRVVYDDVHLIEIETKLAVPEWSAVSRAYTTPSDVFEQVERLRSWCSYRTGEVRIEFGADTRIGWTCLRFYPIDKAGHVVCQLRLASGHVPSDGRDEEVSRVSIEMHTEPGLIQRFIAELRHLAESLEGEAVLQGLAR
ncbi:MAG: hypothetical protein KDA22_10995 [Phycisphaerales bacterium]|nr:hypothetical protein [Phycisphaerales bacterium]